MSNVFISSAFEKAPQQFWPFRISESRSFSLISIMEKDFFFYGKDFSPRRYFSPFFLLLLFFLLINGCNADNSSSLEYSCTSRFVLFPFSFGSMFILFFKRAEQGKVTMIFPVEKSDSEQSTPPYMWHQTLQPFWLQVCCNIGVLFAIGFV